MSKEGYEYGLGVVYFSYVQGERKAKREQQASRRRFVPDFQDIERLLPRLRNAPRRGGRL